MKTVFLCESEDNVRRVFSSQQIETVKNEFSCDGIVYSKKDLERLSDTEIIFSTWGMPALSESEIETYLPGLKYIFYAAGTIKAFAGPFLARGVRVFSAWQINAVPVKEIALSEILLASKGFYYLSRLCKYSYENAFSQMQRFPGNYGAKVGLIGLGAIGKQLLAELKRFDLDIYVCSSKITKENEASFGVHAATMEEIFESCDVVSNHLANVPETVGIINKSLLSKMKPYSTFINTGRGAQVDESALIEKLSSDETVTAVLDVTDPEPPAEDSAFYTLPNCVLTPHFAGSSGLEVQRMAKTMIDECRSILSGSPCRYEVSAAMLDRMA